MRIRESLQATAAAVVAATVIGGLALQSSTEANAIAAAPPDVTVTVTTTTTETVPPVTTTATVTGPPVTTTSTATVTGPTSTSTITTTATVPGPVTTVTVTGPASTTTQTSTSTATSTATVTASAPPSTPPAKTVPWRVVALTLSSGRRVVNVSWAPPKYNGGSRITGYKVRRNGRDSTGGGAYATVLRRSARSFQFTLLRRHTTYEIRVAAINALGRSPWRIKTVTTK